MFLDEIAETTPGLQAKLLRFLEEKTFRRVGGNAEVCPDVRVVAATHKDLRATIDSGAFREDLYYRLAVLQIRVPPLRERDGDVTLLAKLFLERFNREFGQQLEGFAPSALEALERYGWPGNVRELRNAIERAVLLCDGPRVGVADIEIPTAQQATATLRLPAGGVDLEQLERQFVEEALERCHGNQTKAARLLGLTRDQIRYRIAKFDLPVPRDE